MTGHQLPKKPIFGHEPEDMRHRIGHPHASVHLHSTVMEPPRTYLPSINAWEGIAGGTLCATWDCPGCGRQLISAVHDRTQPPTWMFCTKECEARARV
jgi:hypothetical protein